MPEAKKETSKKDSFYSKVAFYLSLGFWIPLFNIGLCALSLWLSIKALKGIMSEPGKFSGLFYAGAAFVISLGTLVFTVIFYLVYIQTRMSCDDLGMLGF